jgi:hypothetical protein
MRLNFRRRAQSIAHELNERLIALAVEAFSNIGHNRDGCPLNLLPQPEVFGEL